MIVRVKRVYCMELFTLFRVLFTVVVRVVVEFVDTVANLCRHWLTKGGFLVCSVDPSYSCEQGHSAIFLCYPSRCHVLVRMVLGVV